MAAAEPPKSEPKSAKRAVLCNCGKGITGTAGIKTAGRSLKWGNEPLIDPDEEDNSPADHWGVQSLVAGTQRALQFFGDGSIAKFCSTDLGDNGKIGMEGQAELIFPEKFPQKPFEGIPLNRTTNFATDGQAETAGTVRPGQAVEDKMPRVNFLPVPPHQSEISGMPNPQSRGKRTVTDRRQDRILRNYLLGMETTRFLRPLARRRLRTILPFLLCIRLRNPWVRFRLTRLG